MAGQSEIPWYHSDPRIGSSIADLLVRQGDIQAQRAQQVGNLWANAVGNVGNIAAGAVQQHQEQKQTRKREQAFSEAISAWDPADPRGSTMRLATVVGPQEAMKFGAGLMSFEAAIQKQAKGEIPTIDETKTALTAAAILNKNAPGMFDQQYGNLRATYGQAIKQHLGYDLPEAPTPEIKQGLMALGEQWGGKDAGAENVVVGGRIVNRVSGKPVYEPPPEVKEAKPPATQNIGGQVVQFNPESGRYDIPLGASESALNRQAAEIARATALGEKQRTETEKKAEKAQEAATARRESDSQVSAAFGAMKAALKEVEKYSRTGALTSPLEAANARQQYQAAASAFAATLSRATGDTRISDLDRKAYAVLLTYTGPGKSIVQIARPDLVRKRLEEAESFFDAAKKAREEGRAAPPEESPSGGARSGTGTLKDPYVFE